MCSLHFINTLHVTFASSNLLPIISLCVYAHSFFFLSPFKDADIFLCNNF